MNINQIYDEFAELGLTQNQSDFARTWLGREDSYLRVLNSKGRDISAGARSNLIARIRSHQRVIGWATSAEAKITVNRLNAIAESVNRELIEGGW